MEATEKMESKDDEIKKLCLVCEDHEEKEHESQAHQEKVKVVLEEIASLTKTNDELHEQNNLLNKEISEFKEEVSMLNTENKLLTKMKDSEIDMESFIKMEQQNANSLQLLEETKANNT